MKLDPTIIRTMNRSDFRVLAAVEQGMKNHALVPAPLITAIANLRHGGTHKILSSLLRDKLVSHDRTCGYDGYRLTNAGYDILALYHLKQQKLISALGNRIGTGKESDIYIAASPEGKQVVLKFHRLGRTSFRDVKKKRDYFNYNAKNPRSHRGGPMFKEQPNSWLFLSRVSALKEYAFMKALHGVGYPTPTPLGQNRHIVVMSLVRGIPLYQVHASRVSPAQAQSIFEQSTTLATRLVKHGLVHCDLNEFNLMVDLSGIQAINASEEDAAGDPYVRHSGLSVEIKGALSAHGPLQHRHVDATGEIITEAPPEPKELLENGEPKPVVTLIDFPQMVSTRHPNAKELYEHDLECVRRFFVMKLKCSPEGGEWEELMPRFEDLVLHDADGTDNLGGEEDGACLASRAQLRLDQELQASGYSVEDSCRDMELYYFERNHTSTIEGEDESDDSAAEEEEGNNYRCGEIKEDVENAEQIEDRSFDAEEIESEDDGVQAGMSQVDATSILSQGDIAALKLAEAEEQAKQRVKRYMEEEKRRMKKTGAFRTRNSNKTFVKGKRVMNDCAW